MAKLYFAGTEFDVHESIVRAAIERAATEGAHTVRVATTAGRGLQLYPTIGVALLSDAEAGYGFASA